jgi:hypothetical protein
MDFRKKPREPPNRVATMAAGLISRLASPVELPATNPPATTQGSRGRHGQANERRPARQANERRPLPPHPVQLTPKPCSEDQLHSQCPRQEDSNRHLVQLSTRGRSPITRMSVPARRSSLDRPSRPATYGNPSDTTRRQPSRSTTQKSKGVRITPEHATRLRTPAIARLRVLNATVLATPPASTRVQHVLSDTLRQQTNRICPADTGTKPTPDLDHRRHSQEPRPPSSSTSLISVPESDESRNDHHQKSTCPRTQASHNGDPEPDNGLHAQCMILQRATLHIWVSSTTLMGKGNDLNRPFE